LLLIRHAQSLANAAGRVQGWADAPLSPQGEAQARFLAAWLRDNNPGADALFASPLRRTYQTAEAVGAALGLPVQSRPGLREVCIGRMEDTLEADFDRAMQAAESEAAFEQEYGIEPARDFAERALGALHGLLAAYHGQTLIVVTHLGVICNALAYWIDRDTSVCWQTYGHIRNTSISEIHLHERIEVVSYGALPHLS
jgi:broad specificity phosphatase PhoE